MARAEGMEGRAPNAAPRVRATFLEQLLAAAEQHGQDGDSDHEVGDLQGIAWALWALLTPAQIRAFKRDPEMLALIKQWGEN